MTTKKKTKTKRKPSPKKKPRRKKAAVQMGPKPLPVRTEAGIRARWSSCHYKLPEELAPHYKVDIGLLLDEVDRLRYKLEHGT